MRPSLNKAFEEEMRRRIEEVRKTIDCEKIVKRMQGFALATVAELSERPDLFMSKEQILAADKLLKKAMPDMKEIEHTGPGGGPLQVVINDPTRR